MKLPAVITTDWHLTANPRDEYRWGLVDWLITQQPKWEAETLCILGDLTDAKDHHGAELVNRIVLAVTRLSTFYRRIIILMGNHDYLRAGHAFFSFLSTIPGVTFVTKPLDTCAEGAACLFLPHTKTPAADWAGFDFSYFEFVFMHQTFKGAKASNGQEMDGEPMPDLSQAGRVLSGDIHVPQKIGPLEYVGSPYHVHFGDRFRPRCLVLGFGGRGKVDEIRYSTISRVTLDVDSLAALRGQRLHEGDQVKVRFKLSAADLFAWRAIRAQAQSWLQDKGVDVHGIELIAPGARRRVRVGFDDGGTTPEAVIQGYVEREDLGADCLDIGLEIIDASR
jgi:hypothetical protein